MNRKVTILSKEDLEKRYSGEMANTRMAKLTKEALELGYSIALIEQEHLHESNMICYDVQVALECHFPCSSTYIEVWGFTDLSEFNNDKLYCAFRELKGRASAHSMTYPRIS